MFSHIDFQIWHGWLAGSVGLLAGGAWAAIRTGFMEKVGEKLFYWITGSKKRSHPSGNIIARLRQKISDLTQNLKKMEKKFEKEMKILRKRLEACQASETECKADRINFMMRLEVLEKKILKI